MRQALSKNLGHRISNKPPWLATLPVCCHYSLLGINYVLCVSPGKGLWKPVSALPWDYATCLPPLLTLICIKSKLLYHYFYFVTHYSHEHDYMLCARSGHLSRFPEIEHLGKPYSEESPMQSLKHVLPRPPATKAPATRPGSTDHMLA